MDDVRVGHVFRVIRHRNGWRQSDVARRAGVARETVSRLERGGLGRQPLDVVRAISSTLGVRVDVLVRWRGGDLDRVLNAGHASLHESLARHLGSLEGWTWRPEVSYSIWGERGVIDILAWHAASRSLLIIELKTELVGPQELAASMHRRVRLGNGDRPRAGLGAGQREQLGRGQRIADRSPAPGAPCGPAPGRLPG